MDVNGTQFHLLHGQDDWGSLLPFDDTRTLSELWAEVDEIVQPPVDWNTRRECLQLTRETPIFVNPKETGRLSTRLRRGADADQYGNWYWINPEENGIRFLPRQGRTSVEFWSWEDYTLECEQPVDPATFSSSIPPMPAQVLLRGLAVTKRHYLVVGNVSEHGILIFDLHQGSPPMLMQWPDDVPFVPWDMVAKPDGGVLILDRENARYWDIDEHFRVLSRVDDEMALFQPSDEDLPGAIARRTIRPVGYPLTPADPEQAFDPISIENGPDGNVLILHTEIINQGQADEEALPSIIDEYRDGERLRTYSLQDAVRAIQDNVTEANLLTLSAYDFAYVKCCVCCRGEHCPDDEQCPDDCADCLDLSLTESGAAREVHLLFVARGDGNQVIAFEMNREVFRLDAQKDYLPLRRWEAKGLVAADSRVYYDFADRWVPLQVTPDCRYARLAIIHTSDEFSEEIAGQQFDSNIPGCTWHRMFLDANIPANTRVSVRARAADEISLLRDSNWRRQPKPYLRNDASELPYIPPPADQVEGDSRQGTWELLFQDIVGRYVQIELTMEGSGQSTPQLYAMRVWYPRFSYADNYMPVIYRQDPGPTYFLERWLANFEGMYTNLEDKIQQIAVLMDARTAPAETLDWLAGWLGLVMDPIWQEKRRRLFIRHAYDLYRYRGTVAGIEIALRLFLEDESDIGEWLFDPECYFPGNIRIIEHFMTRAVDPLVYGDPTTEHLTDDPADTAHRFSVLLPHGLSEAEFDMVRRIVELERPVHTSFDLKFYWDAFRVGEARLAIDTQLGETNYLGSFIVGDTTLPHGYLEAGYPFNIEDRIISDRDRLGDLPEL